MNLIISGKGMDLTDGIKNAINEGLGKFDTYFTEDTKVNVTCKVQKNNQIIEITIPVKGNVIRVSESSNDLYSSLDSALSKLDRQVKKFKNKIRDKKMRAIVRNEVPYDFTEAPVEEIKDDIEIVKTKKFDLTVMEPKEACEELVALDHNFFLFINKETGKFSVAYKRYDDKYGIIECDKTSV